MKPIQVAAYIFLSLIVVIVPFTGKLYYPQRKKYFNINFRGYIVLIAFILLMWMINKY